MSKVSEIQKRIYNCYLKNLRYGQPYRPRQDFSDIDPNTMLCLVKLSSFFQNYPHINIEEYFEAPNVLFKGDKYPPLKSFIGRSAIRNYSLYQRQKQDRNPETQFDEIRDSFKFIGLFCIANKIHVGQYLRHKTGYMYSWLDHYRQNRVNPYALFGIDNLIQIMNDIPRDERDLFANNLEENLISFYNRYEKSPKTKAFCKELLKKIDSFVSKELTSY
jgi:hypothetical protein